jgi:hypothetical protein
MSLLENCKEALRRGILALGKAAQGVARMTRNGRRERKGCAAGAGGRPTIAAACARHLSIHRLAGHRRVFSCQYQEPFTFTFMASNVRIKPSSL